MNKISCSLCHFFVPFVFIDKNNSPFCFHCVYKNNLNYCQCCQDIVEDKLVKCDYQNECKYAKYFINSDKGFSLLCKNCVLNDKYDQNICRLCSKAGYKYEWINNLN
jgi:hypothetical protein